MPLRAFATRRASGELRIYRRLRYGRLAEFAMLDDRQYRTDNPAATASRCAARRR